MELQNADALLPWGTQVANHHNVRALCDLEGLTWEQKEVLAACVYVESQFYNDFFPDGRRVEHQNFVWENGVRVLSSTDVGIVQVNDWWHIGPGKDFPSVEYVFGHPEECVRWMCRYYKQHGHLNAWCSFTSGAYKEYLGKV